MKSLHVRAVSDSLLRGHSSELQPLSQWALLGADILSFPIAMLLQLYAANSKQPQPAGAGLERYPTLV